MAVAMPKPETPTLVWLVLKPAADVLGQWVAHCLELDVVTQGNSLAHALEMGREVVALTLADDLDAGRSPRDRGPAPEEYWMEYYEILTQGERLPLRDSLAAAGDVRALAVPLRLTFHPPEALDEPAWVEREHPSNDLVLA